MNLVFVGKGSKWENPYESIYLTKEEHMSKYEAYIMNQPNLLDDLWELEGTELIGYSYNYHIEILKRMVEDRLWLK